MQAGAATNLQKVKELRSFLCLQVRKLTEVDQGEAQVGGKTQQLAGFWSPILLRSLLQKLLLRRAFILPLWTGMGSK